MVVCYGSAARPINQAASWLPEVMHAKGPVASPQKLHRRNQGRKVYFPCSAHWSSVRGLPVVLPILLDTNMCCCTCCTCQRKLGVRLTLVLPPSRMPLASASAAVALIARQLDGGPFQAREGFCAPSRLRCLGGGSSTGSLGLCARCPCSSVRGPARRPPRPLRFAGFLLLLFLWCLGCGVDITIVVSPPVRWCHFRRAGFSFHTRQRSLSCCPPLFCGFVCTASGSFLNFSPFWRRCWFSYALPSPLLPFVVCGFSCEVARPS